MNYSILLKHIICFLSPNVCSCPFLYPKWPLSHLGQSSRSTSYALWHTSPAPHLAFLSLSSLSLKYSASWTQQNDVCLFHLIFEPLRHSLLFTFCDSHLYLVFIIHYLWFPEGKGLLVFLPLPCTVLTAVLQGSACSAFYLLSQTALCWNLIDLVPIPGK